MIGSPTDGDLKAMRVDYRTSDLPTLRPYPWGLLVALEGTLDVVTAKRLQEAVKAAEPSEALFHDGVGAYQITLDGYVNDGLDQLGEYLFETGTLSEVPAVPFIVIPKDDDEEDEEA